MSVDLLECLLKRIKVRNLHHLVKARMTRDTVDAACNGQLGTEHFWAL